MADTIFTPGPSGQNTGAITQENYQHAPPRVVDGVEKPALYRLGEGLLMQVTPSKAGVSRSWMYRYSIAGKERRMGLGPVSEMSLEKARIECAILSRQKDPLAARQRQQREEKREVERPKPITFAEAAKRYTEDKIRPRYEDPQAGEGES